VQTTVRPGELRVKVTADGLRGAEIVLHAFAVPGAAQPAITALDR